MNRPQPLLPDPLEEQDASVPREALGDAFDVEAKRAEERREQERIQAAEALSLTNAWARLSAEALPVVNSLYFEAFILLCIFANCVFIAIMNPKLDDDAPEIKAGEAAEYFFMVVFTFEAALKICASGFWGREATKEEAESNLNCHRGVGYFRSGWNRLDFLIVVLSYVNLIPGSSNFTVFRLLRMLRPLRAVSHVPELKVLTNTLLRSLYKLVDVGILLVFFYTIFAILTVQLWNGVLHQRCYDPITDLPVEEEMCGTAAKDTPYGRECPPPLECRQTAGNPPEIYANFDNFAHALLTLWQVIVGADWFVIYGYVNDAWGTPAWFIFFCIITFMSFFAMNLVLAVIFDSFEEEQEELRKAKQESKEKQIAADNAELRDLGLLDENDQFLFDAEDTSGDTEMAQLRPSSSSSSSDDKPLAEIPAFARTAAGEEEKQEAGGRGRGVEILDGGVVKQLPTPAAVSLDDVEEDDGDDGDDDLSSRKSPFGTDRFLQEFNREQAARRRERSLEERHLRHQRKIHELFVVHTAVLESEEELQHRHVYLKSKPDWVWHIYRLIDSPGFTAAVIGAILLNTLCLMLQHHNQSESMTDFLHSMNIIFIVFFTVEMILKLIGLGWKGYARDGFNLFDAIVVLVSLVEVFAISGDGAGVSSFRALRLLRVFRLAKSLRSLQILLQMVTSVLRPIFWMSVLLLLYMFIFGVMGMQLFSGKRNEDGEVISEAHFEDVYWAMMSAFQYITDDDMFTNLYLYWEATDGFAVVYFILAGLIGVDLVGNMFVSIILSGFGDQDEEQFVKNLAGDESWSEYRRHYRTHRGFPERKSVIQRIIRLVNQEQAKDRRARETRAAHRKLQSAPIPLEDTKTLGVFGPDHILRRFAHWVCGKQLFDDVVMLFILGNCVTMMIESPLNSERTVNILHRLDLMFAIVFSVELLLKAIAYGLLRPKHGYLRSIWNQIDALVVVFSWMVVTAFGSLAFLKTLRAIRPLRLIVRSDGIKMVVSALYYTMPAIGNVIMFTLLFLVIFAIMGVNFFAGKYAECTDPAYTSQSDCEAAGELWRSLHTNYDNFFQAMITTFQASTTSGWGVIMYQASSTTQVGQGMVPEHNNAWGILFFFLVIICGFFAFNLFVGVVVDNFNRLRAEFSGSALMTEAQVKWQETQKLLRSTKLRPRHAVPAASWRALAFRLVSQPWFDPFIMGCILVNTVIMATQHYQQSEAFTDFLWTANLVFVIIFAVEAGLKLLGLSPSVYFRDNWNRFDFLLVVLSFLGLGINVGVGPSVIRVFRVGRVFRLIKRARGLQRLFSTLVLSLPSLWNISAFLVVVFFIFAILGVKLFGTQPYRDEEGFSRHFNFRTFPNAMWTIFRLATGDAWEFPMWGSMLTGPDCDSELYTCGSSWSPIFYIAFTLFGSLIMINLFIAVVLENFSEQDDDREQIFRSLQSFTNIWLLYDPDASGYVSARDFVDILRRSPSPIGFNARPDVDRREIFRVFLRCNIHIFLMNRKALEDAGRIRTKIQEGKLVLPDILNSNQLHTQSLQGNSSSSSSDGSGNPPAGEGGNLDFFGAAASHALWASVWEDRMQQSRGIWMVKFSDAVRQILAVVSDLDVSDLELLDQEEMEDRRAQSLFAKLLRCFRPDSREEEEEFLLEQRPGDIEDDASLEAGADAGGGRGEEGEEKEQAPAPGGGGGAGGEGDDGSEGGRAPSRAVTFFSFNRLGTDSSNSDRGDQGNSGGGGGGLGMIGGVGLNIPQVLRRGQRKKRTLIHYATGQMYEWHAAQTIQRIIRQRLYRGQAFSQAEEEKTMEDRGEGGGEGDNRDDDGHGRSGHAPGQTQPQEEGQAVPVAGLGGEEIEMGVLHAAEAPAVPAVVVDDPFQEPQAESSEAASS